MSYTQTSGDIINILIGKYTSLISACKLFDAGDKYEAKEISTKIRSLLHDTKQSTSIISHLKKKSKILFFNSGLDYDPTNLYGTLSLVSLQFDRGTWSFKENFYRSDNINRIDFDKWWNNVILSDTKFTITRKDIILEMTNKDGGAHIDASKKLGPAYAKVAKESGIGWKVGSEVLMGVELFSVRQIAHEVILTLGQEFTELKELLDEYNSYIGMLESVEFERDAVVCFENKEFEKSLDFCEMSLAKNRRNLNAMSIKQAALGELGRFGDLMKELDFSLSMYPLNPIFLTNLAFTYLTLKEFNKVLEVTEKLLWINPNDTKTLMYRAISFAELGNIEEAIKLLLNAHKSEPLNIDIMQNLCFAYSKVNNTKNVLKFAKMILNIDIGNMVAKEYLK